VSSFALPDHVYARFRTVSFERLERIEAMWLALTHGGGDAAGEDGMYRDLHTLKGDARVVGFVDVAVLCQRLEDMLAAARARRYRVHEDVDIVVNMGLQFIGMLLRKKQGAARGGIDLDGFLKQLEEVLAEWLRRSSEAPALGAPAPVPLRVGDSNDLGSTASRDRISVAATSVYLESLRVGQGAARSRLRDVWRVLAREVALADATPLAPVVERHASAVTQLAQELGKSVTVVRDVKDAAVPLHAIDAINTAVLHALRNALDHGIEPPEMRRAAGKPPTGTISVRAIAEASGLAIVLQDDGGGVDLARVRERAIAKGLLAPDATPTEADLLEVLFVPGFSTRDAVTELSGRGVGLDAVRAAVVRIGGKVDLSSTAGHGARLVMRVPQASRTIDANVFRGVRTGVLFAVPATWALAEAGKAPPQPLDLAEALALPPSGAPAPASVLELRRDAAALFLSVGAPPVQRQVTRLCPTPDAEAFEIVDVGRTEAVLVRPERLSAEQRGSGR
jgi:two-component system chemotaxis sensor kinase CheA